MLFFEEFDNDKNLLERIKFYTELVSDIISNLQSGDYFLEYYLVLVLFSFNLSAKKHLLQNKDIVNSKSDGCKRNIQIVIIKKDTQLFIAKMQSFRFSFFIDIKTAFFMFKNSSTLCYLLRQIDSKKNSWTNLFFFS